MPKASSLVFGLVPHVSDDPTRTALDELCVLLSEDLGRPVTPCRAGSPMALASLLQHGEIHFAWMSPTLALLSPELEGVVPLLSSVRQGLVLFHSVLFAASSSDIHSVEDLAGRSVAWVARTSASGYLVPRLSLLRQGLDVRRLFEPEIFCNSHGAAAWAVHGGRADVGATYAVFEGADPRGKLLKSGFLDYLPEFEPRIIDSAGPIPADMIVANPAVPADLCAGFAVAMSRLANDPIGSRHVRTVIGADAFRPFSQESLDALEELVAVARSGGLI